MASTKSLGKVRTEFIGTNELVALSEQCTELKQIMFKKTLIALVATAILCSCNLGAPQKHTLNASFDIAVTDTDIKHFTDITKELSLDASGEFTPGVFFLGATPISCSPGTRFHLVMNLPIDNPAVISTKNARGALTLTQPISVAMVPTPLEIKLAGGKVNAAVDLGRCLGAFFINLVQIGQPKGDLRRLVHTMRIERATLHLREGSQLKTGDRIINIGSDSTVSLKNASITNDLDYKADCEVDLNLRKCDWVGERIDTLFQAGTADLNLEAEKKGGTITLKLLPDSKLQQDLLLKACTFKFGKNKRSSSLSDHCKLKLREFTWRRQGNSAPSTMHLVSSMDFTGTDLKLKTDIHTTDGFFKETIPGKLEVDIKNSGPRETHFSTTGPATAENGCITISKGNTDLKLWLAKTTIGPACFDKLGSMHFELEKGQAAFKQLDLETAKSKFSLVAAGNSTLKLPGTMLLDKPQSATSTQLKLPLELKMGEAKLVTPRSQVQLSKLTGLITIDVDKEIKLTSDMDFVIEKSKLLGDYGADVKVDAFDVYVKNGQTDLRLKKCVLCIPEKAFCDSITKRLPKTLVFEPDKVVMEKKRWRYKEAVVNKVYVSNVTLSEVRADGDSKLRFNVSGDVEMEGTIEKASLLAVVANSKKWETRPWTLSGHIQGTGTVKYEFTPEKASAESYNSDRTFVKYDLSLDLPLPDDMKLDWSKVASGFIKSAEKKAILSHLSKINVPINHKDQIELFSNSDSQWSNLAVSDLICSQSNQDLQLQFNAHVRTSTK